MLFFWAPRKGANSLYCIFMVINKLCLALSFFKKKEAYIFKLAKLKPYNTLHVV